MYTFKSHKTFQAGFWIITSGLDVNKVPSSALHVLNLLLERVKVKRAVIYNVQSLYKVIMWSYMTGESMTTYVPCCPELLITQLSQLHTSCFECRFNLEGIVFATRVEHTNLHWDSHSQLSCTHQNFLLCSFVYRQRQTGPGDDSSSVCQTVAALRCLESENARWVEGRINLPLCKLLQPSS